MGEETQTMLGSTFSGSSEIKHRLAHKRVLLIHLESLAGGHCWFGYGSKIIVTTRELGTFK